MFAKKFSADEKKAYYIGVGMRQSDSYNRRFNGGVGSSNPFNNDILLSLSWQKGYFSTKNDIANLDCKKFEKVKR